MPWAIQNEDSVVKRLRPDTAIWLGTALILAVISAGLTWWITSVNRTPAQNGIELGFDLTGTALSASVTPPNVVLTSLGNTLRIAFNNVDRRSIEDLNVGPLLDGNERNVRCENDELDATLGYIEQLPIDTKSQPLSNSELRATEVDESRHPVMIEVETKGVSVRSPGDIFINVVCEMPSPVVHDTYTSRSLVVVQRGSQDRDTQKIALSDYDNIPFDAQRITLNDADADEIHVTDLNSGDTRISSTFPVVRGTADATGAKLKYHWESITAAQQRDIVIVVIGSLIALAAAALIEALRPYVDQLVGERDSFDQENETR
jgi:hypothetical protein